MAKEWIPQSLYIGADRTFTLEILNEPEDAAIDITGWTLTWLLKRSRHHLDAAALLSKTTGAGQIVISGVFNASPAVNTQRCVVTIADTDTDAFTPGMCVAEIKRMDAGFETPLASGALELKRGVVRA
jgi:hypothetical protein